jgi:hypothetical protein
MVIFGGGHTDYYGSDVHAFDIASRRWSRLSDGFVGGKASDYGPGAYRVDSRYPDGSPLPPHTYEYVQYDPVANQLLLFKGQTELGPDVKSVAIPHLLNLDSSGGWTAWDSTRRTLWGNSGDDGGGNAFIGFQPDGENGDKTVGSWTTMYPNKLPGEANHNSMAYCADRDILVVAAAAPDRLFAIDPAAPERSVSALNSVGSRPAINEFAAFDYAPNLGRFVYYSSCDGPRLYSVAPPDAAGFSSHEAGEWRWQGLLDVANRTDPVADAAALSRHETNTNHTFGRFRIATFGTTDVAVLLRHIDSPVYALRLTM